MIGIVLAAGQGKRLAALTRDVSKSMLPVRGLPVVKRVLRRLADASGMKRFVVVALNDRQDTVAELRERPLPDLDITFAYQSTPLGMAHALQAATDSLGAGEPVCVAACDNLYKASDLRAFFDAASASLADAFLALVRAGPDEVASGSAVVLQGGQVAAIVEKPDPSKIASDLVSLPLYVFLPSFFPYLERVEVSPRGEYELQEAIQMLIDDKRPVRHYLMSTRMTLTTVEDLLRLNTHFLETEGTEIRSPAGDTWIEKPVFIDKDCHIGPGCSVGPNVCVSGGAVLMAECELQNAVVLPGAFLPRGTKAANAAVTTEGRVVQATG